MRVLDEFPEWQEHEAAVEEADENQRRISAQVQAARERRAAAEAEHAAKVREAALTGGTVPDDLPPPSRSHADAAQLAQQRVIDVRAQETAVLARISGAIEERVGEEIASLMQQAQEAVAIIEAKAEDVTELLRLLQRARRAEENESGMTLRPSVSGQTRSAVTPGELIDAVRDGTDLTVPLPTLGMQMQTNILKDSGDAGEEVRRLARLPAHNSMPRLDRTRGFL